MLQNVSALKIVKFNPPFELETDAANFDLRNRFVIDFLFDPKCHRLTLRLEGRLLRPSSENPETFQFDEDLELQFAQALAEWEESRVQISAQSDRPWSGGADILGSHAFASSVANIISHSATQTPLVVGIDAPWGSGKTSLAEMIRRHVKSVETFSKTYWFHDFNAWLHDDADSLSSAFIASLVDAIEANRPLWKRILWPGRTASNSKSRVSHALQFAIATTVLCVALLKVGYGYSDLLGGDWLLAWAAIGAAWIWRFDWLTKALGAGTLGVDVLGDFLKDFRQPQSDGRMRTLRAELQSLVKSSLNKESKLVIFIDDIERCRPPKGVELLETINQLLEISGVVVILLGDLNIVERHVTLKYSELAGADSIHFGRHYLEKIVQLRIPLPTLNPRQSGSTLLQLSQLDSNLPEASNSPGQAALGPGLSGSSVVGPLRVWQKLMSFFDLPELPVIKRGSYSPRTEVFRPLVLAFRLLALGTKRVDLQELEDHRLSVLNRQAHLFITVFGAAVVLYTLVWLSVFGAESTGLLGYFSREGEEFSVPLFALIHTFLLPLFLSAYLFKFYQESAATVFVRRACIVAFLTSILGRNSLLALAYLVFASSAWLGSITLAECFLLWVGFFFVSGVYQDGSALAGATLCSAVFAGAVRRSHYYGYFTRFIPHLLLISLSLFFYFLIPQLTLSIGAVFVLLLLATLQPNSKFGRGLFSHTRLVLLVVVLIQLVGLVPELSICLTPPLILGGILLADRKPGHRFLILAVCWWALQSTYLNWGLHSRSALESAFKVLEELLGAAGPLQNITLSNSFGSRLLWVVNVSCYSAVLLTPAMIFTHIFSESLNLSLPTTSRTSSYSISPRFLGLVLTIAGGLWLLSGQADSPVLYSFCLFAVVWFVSAALQFGSALTSEINSQRADPNFVPRATAVAGLSKSFQGKSGFTRRGGLICIDDSKAMSEAVAFAGQWAFPVARHLRRLSNVLRFWLYYQNAIPAGDTPTTAQVAKWVLLSEQWPSVLDRFRARPELCHQIETSHDVQPILVSEFGTYNSTLAQFLRSEPALHPVLSRFLFWNSGGQRT